MLIIFSENNVQFNSFVRFSFNGNIFKPMMDRTLWYDELCDRKGAKIEDNLMVGKPLLEEQSDRCKTI